MNVAMYMPGLRPGSPSWEIYQDLAAAVRALGQEFEIWTDRPEAPPQPHPHTRYLRRRDRRRGLDGALAPLLRTRRLLGTRKQIGAALSGPNAPDLLYSEILYPYGAGAELARAASGWGGALVVKPTGEDVLSIPEAAYGFRRFRLPRRLIDRTLRRADAIRCISPLVLETIRGLSDRPHRVIPSAITNRTAAQAERPPEASRQERRQAREALGEPLRLESRPLILSLGRLHPFKGIDVLLRALVLVPDAVLAVAGPSLRVKSLGGDYESTLRRLAEELDVQGRVRFLGQIPHDRVGELYAAADVVAVPSLLESMNKVCVEAAAAGTPFVVTETTGICGFLQDDGVGLPVPPRDPQRLAAGIERVLNGSWRRDHDAARRFVGRFAPATVAPQLLELFAEARE